MTRNTSALALTFGAWLGCANTDGPAVRLVAREAMPLEDFEHAVAKLQILGRQLA